MDPFGIEVRVVDRDVPPTWLSHQRRRGDGRELLPTEAAALGVPAYTPFAARLGAVDRLLIAERRLNRLERPEDVALRRRDRGPAPPLRDPEALVDLILDAPRARVPAT